jgi:uroporphyrinogen decarboxylase
VFFHSDGRFEELIPDLIRIGFRGLHCIDGNAGMDVQRIRDTYGDALCLWGHLSVEDLAGWKEPTYAQDLRDELALLSASGGCILGTTCGIFEGIDLEALIAIHNSPQAGA